MRWDGGVAWRGVFGGLVDTPRTGFRLHLCRVCIVAAPMLLLVLVVNRTAPHRTYFGYTTW